MPLLRKLALFAVILSAFLATALLVVREVQINKLGREHLLVLSEQKLAQSITDLRYYTARMHSSLANFVVGGEPIESDQFKSARAMFNENYQYLLSQRANNEVLQKYAKQLDLEIQRVQLRITGMMSYGQKDLNREVLVQAYTTYRAERERGDDALLDVLLRMQTDQLDVFEAKREAFATQATPQMPMMFLKWAAVVLFLGGCIGLVIDYVMRAEPSGDLTSAALDTVTRLPTRQHLRAALNRAGDKADRNTSRFGIICIDINHFREVNETFGYEVGDQMLRKIAERIMRHVKEDDLLVRMPGDEFALLAFRRTKEALDLLMTNLIAEMERPARIGDQVLGMSGSLGAAIYPEEGRDADKLFGVAQERLDLVRKEQTKSLKIYKRVDDAISEIKLHDSPKDIKKASRRRNPKDQVKDDEKTLTDSSATAALGAAGVAGVVGLMVSADSTDEDKQSPAEQRVRHENSLDYTLPGAITAPVFATRAGAAAAPESSHEDHHDDLPVLVEHARQTEQVAAQVPMDAEFERLLAEIDPDGSLPRALTSSQVDQMAEHAVNANWELHGDIEAALAAPSSDASPVRDAAFDAPTDSAALAAEQEKLSPLEELARKLLSGVEQGPLEPEKVGTTTVQLPRYEAIEGDAETSASHRADAALNEAAHVTEELVKQHHDNPSAPLTGATAELDRWLKSIRERSEKGGAATDLATANSLESAAPKQTDSIARLNEVASFLEAAEVETSAASKPVATAEPSDAIVALDTLVSESPVMPPPIPAPDQVPAEEELMVGGPDFIFDLRHDGLPDASVIRSPLSKTGVLPTVTAVAATASSNVIPPSSTGDSAIDLIRQAYADIDDGAANFQASIDDAEQSVDFDPAGNPERTYKLPDRPWVMRNKATTPESQAGAKLRERMEAIKDTKKSS